MCTIHFDPKQSELSKEGADMSCMRSASQLSFSIAFATILFFALAVHEQGGEQGHR
jgi:hypothetical protein